MANDYEFYKKMIDTITTTIDNISASVSGTPIATPYTVSTVFNKDKKQLSITASNDVDGSYVRIMRKKDTYGIKLFTKENEKKFEFFRQILNCGDNCERMTLLFTGSDSKDRNAYLKDKVGIMEKSKYNPKDKCFFPSEIVENYYNSDPDLVYFKLFDICVDDKASELLQQVFDHQAHENFQPIVAKMKTNDHETHKLFQTGDMIQKAIYSHEFTIKHLRLYYLINSTGIPDHMRELFKAIGVEFKDYLQSNSPSKEPNRTLDSDLEER